MASGRCLRTLQGHMRGVPSVSLSADGRLALSGSLDQTVRLWEVAQTSALGSWRLSQVSSVAQIAERESQAVGLLEQAEQALGTGQVRQAVDLAQQARAVPGWERFPKSLDVWERLSRQTRRGQFRAGWLERTLEEEHTWGVMSVQLSADGRLALSGSADTTLRLWEVASGRCLRTFQGHIGSATSVSLSADGRLALSGDWSGNLWLWEVTSGRCLRTIAGLGGRKAVVSLSADGGFALTGSEDQTVRLWEVATGQCFCTLEGHTW